MPNIKRSTIGHLFLISALMISGAALAETPDKGDPCPKRAYMDADGDGTVSKQEFMDGHEKMFNRMDTNGDGVLDETERMAHHGKMKGNMQKEGCRRRMSDQ